ncbi:MAG TPA: DUF2278 family protein [Alphaproteobacteria bacterium]|nr:DUF2278 family protein [Alphaproteobacteria bacterium]
MSLAAYGVLACRPVDGRRATDDAPHFQMLAEAGGTAFRIAVNTRSGVAAARPAPGAGPHDLLYFATDDLRHPVTGPLERLAPGFHPLPPRPDGGGLDYVRGNLFDLDAMRTAPMARDGADNDLNDFVEGQLRRALADPAAVLYAFGDRWGPERRRPDAHFGFLPGNGLHDVHMNQGNDPAHRGSDGVWQDGGLLVHFPRRNRWSALFLRFQAQSTHTDDRTGHAIPAPRLLLPPHGAAGEGAVRIVAALVNPIGPDHGETVTLLNTTPAPLDLTGWALANAEKRRHVLPGPLILAPGATALVRLPDGVMPLSNGGGLITLLDRGGRKIHGVAYTAEQARREGWTVVF